MRDSVTGSVLDDPLAVTMLEDPFHASLDYPPYPGLRPFVSAEWPIFFGRETMTDEIIGLVTNKHLVVVHGDSGSGKSSIVRAGVLVQLQQGHAATDASWRTCAMLPRDDPLGNLARALAGLLADQPTPDQILDVRHILNRGRRAPETLARRLRQGESDHVCILVDQFEELFSFAKRRGPEDAQLFVEFLVGLEQHPPPGLYAILTMRSEFLGHCARFEGLAEAVNRTQYLLPRMERPALFRAIREPATLYGGEVSQELAERLIADAGGGQDQLPLIQHGLMRLWRRKGAPQRGATTPAKTKIAWTGAGSQQQSPWELAEAAPPYRHDGLSESLERFELDEAPVSFRQDYGPAWHLDMDDYRAVGGLAMLLSDHADEVMARAAPDSERRHIVEHLFRALTDINAEGQAIRRPQTLTELVAVTGNDAPRLEAVIDHFRAKGVFFLTPYGNAPIKPGTLIDISHEALIRCWQKIAGKEEGWLQREFKDGLIWRSLVIQAESFERDSANVLSPASTDERERWLQRRNSAWAERYGGGWERVRKLVEASVATAAESKRREQERLVAEEREKRREVELQGARELAMAEAAKRRSARRWFAVTAIALLFAIGLAAWAYYQGRVADHQRQLAETASDEAEAELQRATDRLAQAERTQASAAQTVATVSRATGGDPVTDVLDRLREATDPYDVAVLAQSLAQLTQRLTLEQAHAALESLTAALQGSTDPSSAIALAQAITALAPVLPEVDPIAAVSRILDILGQTTDRDLTSALAEALGALAPILPEADAITAVSRIRDILGQRKDPHLSSALAKASRANLNRIAGQMTGLNSTTAPVAGVALLGANIPPEQLELLAKEITADRVTKTLLELRAFIVARNTTLVAELLPIENVLSRRADLPQPHLHIQISEEAQRSVTRSIELQLKDMRIFGDRLVVPGIELVRATIPKSALRCFEDLECQTDGRRILDAVNGLLREPQVVLEDLSASRFAATIEPRHYELWFAPGEITLWQAQPE